MRVVNHRVSHDYQILEKFEAGINLIGPEVKSVKGGHADLTGSFVRIVGSEAYLINAKIYPLPYARLDDYDERRTRKLLLHKKEIISLRGKTEGANLSIVPLALYTKKNLVKVEIALAKGKKEYEKRETIKRKDMERELERELRGK
ncbi:MAG: SsrA-binding protein SmpB [bacterium]|nr:SsrA-binding protein SmpB [bacterium]